MLPPQAVDDLATDGQPQACAARCAPQGSLGLVEAFKNGFELGWGNASTCVRDRDL